MLQIKDTVQHNEEFQLLHLQQKMSYMERQVTAMEKRINQYDALADYHLCLKGSFSSRTLLYFKSYFIVFMSTSLILYGTVNIGITSGLVVT